MKKSLLAVAAMGAFASAAQAQSSVTVYGILDVGFTASSSREGGTKIQKAAFSQSSETTSRLGFKGTEDLGGGTSAFFTVELGLNPMNSNLSGTATATDAWQRTSQNSGSAIDNRQSFVGLKKNGIGQVALGRQYTPIFTAAAKTSPGQYNNVVGDMVYASANGAYTTSESGGQTGIGFTNRASNSITVASDSFAGFTANAMAVSNNQDKNQTATTGGTTNWNGWGVGADYTWKKLLVNTAYQSFNTDYATTVANTASSSLSLGGTQPQGAVSTGTNATVFAAGQTRDNQTYVGATYDFGIVKTYVQWVNRKVHANGSQTVARNAQQIGVRGNFTPSIEAWASIGNGAIKTTALGNQSANFTGWQLGSNYLLSKRTNLYAIYGQTQTSSTSMNAGAGASQYALGVRHTF